MQKFQKIQQTTKVMKRMMMKWKQNRRLLQPEEGRINNSDRHNSVKKNAERPILVPDLKSLEKQISKLLSIILVIQYFYMKFYIFYNWQKSNKKLVYNYIN